MSDSDVINTLRLKLYEHKYSLEKNLAIKYHLLDHPKRDLLFAKAWDLGHGRGDSEVEFYYSELIDLVK